MRDIEEFWSKVAGCVCGVVEHCTMHCWEWQGRCDRQGYGTTDVRLYGVRMQYAHRVVWAWVHKQAIEPHTDIKQTCNNRICCNPSHLEARPQAARLASKVLTREQVADLLCKYQAGWPIKRLAAHFNIKPSSVRYRINTEMARLT